jgi:hypothetical protein
MVFCFSFKDGGSQSESLGSSVILASGDSSSQNCVSVFFYLARYSRATMLSFSSARILVGSSMHVVCIVTSFTAHVVSRLTN